MPALKDIRQRLRALGATPYVLGKAEVKALPTILFPGEIIEAFVYGVFSGGWAMLLATDKRLLFVDKIFFDLKVDDVPYSMIAAVEHDDGPFFCRIKVYTRAKNFTFRRVNRSCARDFSHYIEQRMLEAQENVPLPEQAP